MIIIFPTKSSLAFDPFESNPRTANRNQSNWCRFQPRRNSNLLFKSNDSRDSTFDWFLRMLRCGVVEPWSVWSVIRWSAGRNHANPNSRSDKAPDPSVCPYQSDQIKIPNLLGHQLHPSFTEPPAPSSSVRLFAYRCGIPAGVGQDGQRLCCSRYARPTQSRAGFAS